VAADRDTTTSSRLFIGAWRIKHRLAAGETPLLDYDQEGSTLSIIETRYLAGFAWEATARTAGYAKFGLDE